VGTTSRPPKWIKPQLTRLVDEAPAGGCWLHEIKYDGYRMHARIEGSKVTLLTRTGLDWSRRYRRTIEALGSLRVKSAYLDGELCALNGDGVPVFSRLQAAMDEGRTDQLVFFAFDLLFLNGREHGATAADQTQGAAATPVQEGNRPPSLQRARCR
jgi:bifunctional non-homologous end joining protein LigD